MQPENERNTGQTVADEAANDAQVNSEDVADAPRVPLDVAAPKPKRWRLSRKRTLLAVCVLLLVCGGVGAWAVKFRSHPKQAASQQEQVPQAPVAAPKTQEVATLPDVSATEQDRAMQRFMNPTTGEVWLPEWKPLPDQKFWKVQEYSCGALDYFEVGNRGENKIVVLEHCRGTMEERTFLFEAGNDGKVRLIKAPDADQLQSPYESEWYKDSLASNVIIDSAIHYDSLTLPRSLTLQNGHVLKKSAYGGLGERPVDIDGQAVTDVQKFGGSTVQLLERSDSSTNLTSIGYGVVLPLHTRVMMEFQPLELELKDYAWQQGEPRVEDNIAAIARGCGGLFASVTRADTLLDDDVVLAGKSGSGKDVYELKSVDHPLMQKAYQEFQEFYGEGQKDSKYPGISLQDFAQQHAVVLLHDPTGQWLVYARNDLRPQGGCAKPVVYLYPTKPQKVSVRVGANVVVSEPFYRPFTGWEAYATPGGSLLVNGQTYSSLFWEGPGYGEYPVVTSGTVVRTADAPATMRSQLAAQGLNPTEIADFMEYWQDKLPTHKPYVRLTWFDTEQVNRLAPLSVRPQPDTVIRVFLDFEGLDTPVSLPPQHLSAVPRSGFTLVEWGGLAHEPLRK